MPFFSKPVHLLCTLLVSLQVFNLAAAWSLADNCKGNDKDRVQDAMKLVLDMLDYGEKIADKKLTWHPKINLLQDLLGATAENEDQTLDLVKTWFGRANAVASKNVPPDTGVVIHCSDDHLTKAENIDALYFDNSDGRQAQVRVARTPGKTATANACGGQLRAFEYGFRDRYGNQNGKAIVLCSDWSGGAMKASKTTELDQWRKGGDLRVAQGIDVFGGYLSYMILHEMMHAADSTQFPQKLPSGVTERYGYKEITGHDVDKTGTGGPSANDRQHNADSFALLACGWYMKFMYGYVDGKAKIMPQEFRSPLSLRRRDMSYIDIRAPKSNPKPKSSKGGSNPPPTSQAPPPPPPTSKAAPPTSNTPPPSSKAQQSSSPPSSKATPTSVPTSSVASSIPASSSSPSPSSQASSSSSSAPASSASSSSSDTLASSITSISTISSTSSASGSLTTSFSSSASSSSSFSSTFSGSIFTALPDIGYTNYAALKNINPTGALPSGDDLGAANATSTIILSRSLTLATLTSSLASPAAVSSAATTVASSDSSIATVSSAATSDLITSDSALPTASSTGFITSVISSATDSNEDARKRSYY